MYIIYCTACKINGKYYIGQTKRENPRYLGSGKLIKLALKKYGKRNFRRWIIEENLTKEQADIKEKYWIKKLKTTDREYGYNLSDGGEGNPGPGNGMYGINLKEYWEEKYNKDIALEKYNSWKKNISNAGKGKRKSKEFCNKVSGKGNPKYIDIPEEDMNLIIKLFVDENKTYSEIARKLPYSRQTITRRLKKKGYQT